MIWLFSLPIAAFFGFFLLSWFMGGPYAPINRYHLREIVSQWDMRPGMHLVDLGAGDGRVLREIVKSKGISGVGYEINPMLVIYARLRHILGPAGNVRYVFGDLFRADLTQADAVFVHLLPPFKDRLTNFILSSGHSGLQICSYGVALDRLPLVHTLELKSALMGIAPQVAYFYELT